MIKEIVTDTDELSKVCEKIHYPELIKQVYTDLIDTATHWQKQKIGCAGLAANQIGYPYRMFVVWHEGKFQEFINPMMANILFAQTKTKLEGCLSRPGRMVKVTRSKKISMVYTDINEDLYQEKFTGHTARVIAHEYDHLNGIYI